MNIGGSTAGDRNQFTSVDGVGVHLGYYATAVAQSDFDYVLGTGILCESHSGSVAVSGSTFDGSGQCYEGIVTRGSGTLATIRECEISDYRAHIWPEPHGVAVYELTADLGTVANHGINSFHNNSCDLLYASRNSMPDELYAQYNWWGESPPAASSFCGSAAAYIVYDPWLGAPPRAMHGIEPGPVSPDVASLSLASPNPTSGTVDFWYSLNVSGPVELGIWDLQGRLVKALVAGDKPAGTGMATWDGTNEAGRHAASGTYVCRLVCLRGDATCRFVLVR